MDTPLLLIHFNRLDITRRQIEVLASVRPSRIWILCDAARDGREEEASKVSEVRNLLDSLSWNCEIKRLYRDKNLGVRENISTGISWFLDDCGEGIILEDDCLPSHSFFTYATELLERYRDDERIFTISGYTGMSSDVPIETSYCFSNYFSCWGWATWNRAWKRYDSSMLGFSEKNNWESICKRLHPKLRQRLYWNMIFNRVISNQTDSWAYRFLLSMWQNQGLSITPKRNLINNIGFSDDATNTTGMKERETLNVELDFPISHPEAVAKNSYLDKWIEDNCHSKSLPVRINWLLERIKARF